MQTVFQVYNDPGHAWVKVPLKLLEELYILHNISSYSFMRGDSAYLEEDCDAVVFDDAMRERGFTRKYKDHFTDCASRIRGYEDYNCREARLRLEMKRNEARPKQPQQAVLQPAG
jgi:hypothetical protein